MNHGDDLTWVHRTFHGGERKQASIMSLRVEFIVSLHLRSPLRSILRSKFGLSFIARLTSNFKALSGCKPYISIPNAVNCGYTKCFHK